MNRQSALISAALLCLSLSAAAESDPVEAIAIDDSVGDHSQVEWSQAYQQWVASFPRDAGPLGDASGALCATRQSGAVWFLAGSEATAPVTRKCSIPAGKSLFVPIASTVERLGGKASDCAALAQLARETIAQKVSEPALEVDGQPLEGLALHRLATGACFRLGPPDAPQAVADGYYVMLRPLEPGAHTVVFGAKFGAATRSTTYRLDVH